MTRQLLFPNLFNENDALIKNLDYAPWGAHNFASRIHDALNTGEEFKSIGFDEAWNYTNAGYIVYLTAYNWRYYEGLAGKYEYSGHIATCYPTENYENGSYLTAKIIQAGYISEISTIQTIWYRPSYGLNKEMVKSNLYLDYIIDKN